MITLTKLDRSLVVINSDTVKYIEAVPDTLVTFLNGDSLMVREPLEEVLKRFHENRASILAKAHGHSALLQSTTFCHME